MRQIVVLSLVVAWVVGLSISGYLVGFYFGQDSVSSIANETRWECYKETCE